MTGAAFVYIMRDATGLHKIGISNDPYVRRKVVECLIPAMRRPVKLVRAVEVRCGTERGLEMEIHGLLADNRVVGEWFSASMRACNAAIDDVIIVHDVMG